MQELRTILPFKRSPFEIDHQDHLLMVGSCFTEHIGHYLESRKFRIKTNPFGIVYNPVSMAICLNRLLDKRLFEINDLVENQGLWHSFEHHGDFSGTDRESVLANINTQLIESAAHLEKANYILLTLGSAQVFEWRETGNIVANNHKFAASQFNERMLSVAEIEKHLQDVIERILTVNPDCKMILTVSPVRHMRKGAVENQRSKSRLILASETLSTHFPQCVYFPAYELLMDDLRDYRFYADDLLHPSALAIDYVREFFFKTFVRESSQQLADEISKIIFAVRHRPFRMDTPEHQSFVRQQINNLEKLTGKYPELNFTTELEHFKAQISTDSI